MSYVIVYWLGVEYRNSIVANWCFDIIESVIPYINNIGNDIFVCRGNILFTALYLLPLSIINLLPLVIVIYCVDTIIIRKEINALLMRERGHI